MHARQVEVTGTLKADGTLELDGKLDLPPGKVRVIVQAVPEPAAEGWWPYMQRVRAQREAAGYPFMNEQEMQAHIDWLREDDDRIERIYREMEQERRKQDQRGC
jgi:hypothetical protein